MICATGIQTCHWQANLARVWPDDLSWWPTTGMSTGRLPIVIISSIGEIKIREQPLGMDLGVYVHGGTSCSWSSTIFVMCKFGLQLL